MTGDGETRDEEPRGKEAHNKEVSAEVDSAGVYFISLDEFEWKPDTVRRDREDRAHRGERRNDESTREDTGEDEERG
jgi:hypothetical protein